MNNILKFIRYALFILIFIFSICLYKLSDMNSLYVWYILFIFIESFILIIDLKRKNNYSKTFEIISIILFLTHLLLFFRMFLDPSFINDSDIIGYDGFSLSRTNYFYQNLVFLIPMYISLYIYHYLELQMNGYKINNIKIKIALVLTLVNLFFSIYFFSSFMFLFLINFIVLIYIIATLIIYNHRQTRKNELTLFICFIINSLNLTFYLLLFLA